jgi:hypothetical protein
MPPRAFAPRRSQLVAAIAVNGPGLLACLPAIVAERETIADVR